jgi:hypothetical protein
VKKRKDFQNVHTNQVACGDLKMLFTLAVDMSDSRLTVGHNNPTAEGINNLFVTDCSNQCSHLIFISKNS